MAWMRKLESDLWAATVRLPTGKRATKTHKLKGVVKAWVDKLEAEIEAGDWIDPRAGRTTVGELWDRYSGTRSLELASRLRDSSHWRCHVQPYWARVPVGSILKPDVSKWVVGLKEAHKDGCPRRQCRGCRNGAATIQGALGVVRALLEIAVDARMVRHNAARGVSAPRRDAHLDRVLAADEDVALLESLDRQFPGRAAARLFVEVLLYCGLRWEEAAAIDREHVDLRRRLINVGPVVERDGTIRPYPKSPAGQRPVPVDEDLWPRLRERCMAVRQGGLVFTAVRGGTLSYSGWHDRVWQRGLYGRRPADWSGFDAWLDDRMAALGMGQDRELAAAAGVNPSLISSWRSGRFRPAETNLLRLERVLGPAPAAFRAATVTVLDDPQPTPHDLRHTYGTRLGEQGVPPHEIMALMGHEDLESVQRYLHAGDDRFDRARRATTAARLNSATHG